MTQRTKPLGSEQLVVTPGPKAQSTHLAFWMGLILFLGLIVLILTVIFIVFLFQRPPEPQYQVEWSHQPFVVS